MITFRPASTADLSMVSSCRIREPVSWVDPSRYQRELAVGSYRPEWTWLAQTTASSSDARCGGPCPTGRHRRRWTACGRRRPWPDFRR